MGIGPAVAIPATVKSAGLQHEDIDLFEIHEAFASQFVYCQIKLELDPEKINVNGGAMAIGHLLGATALIKAEGVYNQKLQNLALTLDKISSGFALVHQQFNGIAWLFLGVPTSSFLKLVCKRSGRFK